MKKESLSGHEVRQMVGQLDDDKVTAILAVEPSRDELEAALGWASGETELMSETGQHASGKVARVLEILFRDGEWEEDEETPA